MPDSSAMRTGRLVVRYQSPWRRRWVLVCAILSALVFLYGVYEWGRFEGGYSKFAELQHRRELNAKIESLEDVNTKLRGDVAAGELARNVDRQAYADVEKDLAALQAKVLKYQEELTFYRGIVSPEDGIGGLRIQRFQVLPGTSERAFRLRLVLVQSMRQDTVVAGSVMVHIEGVRENKPTQLTLAEMGGETRADGLVPFQFRYFQSLEQIVTVPEGFDPKAVTVEVRSARSAVVRESFPWQVQTEG